jgi:TonB family protein
MNKPNGFWEDPVMKRCLISSAAIHSLLALLLASGIFHPAPIHLGTTYGVDYMGNMGGGGGGNGRPAPTPTVTRAPAEKEETKSAAKTKAPVRTPKAEESAWSLRKKKGRHKAPAQKKGAAAPVKAQAPARTGTAGVQGGEGEGIGVGEGTGPGTGKGSGGFPYSWYLVSVKTKLWREWSRWAGSSQPHNCVVTFSIERDGSVAHASLSQSSGDTFYDQMALRAVNYAAPFPPLPEGYGRGDLDLYVEFKFLAGN